MIILGKPFLAGGIVQNQVFPGLFYPGDDRQGEGLGLFHRQGKRQEIFDLLGTPTGSDERLTFGFQNQGCCLGPGIFHENAEQNLQQRFQLESTGDGLRGFEHRPQIQVGRRRRRFSTIIGNQPGISRL